MATRPVRDRIIRSSTVDESGCWIWTRKLKKGYGRINVTVDGRKWTKFAHRVSYEAFVGPIPDGMEIDHLCSEARCVNPVHLEPVTQAENARRAVERRRAKRLAA